MIQNIKNENFIQVQMYSVITVWRGSTSAASMAMLMASKEGFRTTGISSGRLDFDKFGFIVSKHIICSKQSVIPRRSNTLIAWFLSEFVKICKQITKLKSQLTNWYLMKTNFALLDTIIHLRYIQFCVDWCFAKGFVVERLVWSNHKATFRVRNC